MLHVDLKRKWFVNQCPAQDPKSKSLKMHEAQSIFLVLPVGAAVAIITAVAEVYYYKRWYSGEDWTPVSCSMPG